MLCNFFLAWLGLCLNNSPTIATESAFMNALGDTVTVVYRVAVPATTDGRGPISAIRTTASRATPIPAVTFPAENIPVTAPGILVDTVKVPTGTTLSVGQSSSGQVCAQSVRRTLTSSSRCANWSVIFADAPPPPPDSVTVDPSLTIIGLRLMPDTVTLVMGNTAIFCPFFQFADGKVAKRSVENDCTAIYQSTYNAVQRGVSSAQQARADSQCVVWTVTGGSFTKQVACDQVTP